MENNNNMDNNPDNHSMSDYTPVLQLFYQTIENGINDLPQKEQSNLYKPCAIGCASAFVLKEQQRQFHECNDDLDLQYTKYGRSDFFFADIIEKGHIYEIGYPKCVCPMVLSGFSKNAVHCECSRQSILFILHELLPDKQFEVETIHTVLCGGKECRFRVTMS